MSNRQLCPVCNIPYDPPSMSVRWSDIHIPDGPEVCSLECVIRWTVQRIAKQATVDALRAHARLSRRERSREHADDRWRW